MRRIFTLYAEGDGLTRIAKRLNVDGVPSPRAGTGSWAPTAVREIIRRGLRACAGQWHYDMARNGVVERDAPAKNERLFADLGDALCYAVGEMRPSRPHGRGDRNRTTKASFNPYTYASSVRGETRHDRG